MGEKGKKLSQESVLTTDLLMERLSQIGGITIKKMFGGHGIFHEGKMFGIIDSKGQSYLKADDSNRADFEAFGTSYWVKIKWIWWIAFEGSQITLLQKLSVKQTMFWEDRQDQRRKYTLAYSQR